MKLPDYLRETMIRLKNCETYGAEDLYAEDFFWMLEKAEKENEIDEEIKKILLEESCNNFKNLKF